MGEFNPRWPILSRHTLMDWKSFDDFIHQAQAPRPVPSGDYIRVKPLGITIA